MDKTSAIVPAGRQIVVRVPDTKAAAAIINPLIRRANNLVIRNDEDYLGAFDDVRKIDAFLKSDMIQAFARHVKLLAEAHRSGVGLRDGFVTPAKKAKTIILAKRVAYAERRRKANEAKRARQEERARARQIKDAEKVAGQLRARGEKSAAREIVAFAKNSPVSLPPAEDAVPKTEGSVTKPVFLFEIDDPSLVPIKYRPIDESLVRADVNAFGLDANIPGVHVWEMKKEHSRTTAKGGSK
jgi:hypothetical protein